MLSQKMHPFSSHLICCHEFSIALLFINVVVLRMYADYISDDVFWIFQFVLFVVWVYILYILDFLNSILHMVLDVFYLLIPYPFELILFLMMPKREKIDIDH